MNKKYKKLAKNFFPIILGLVTTGVLTVILTNPVDAQSPESWSEPTNLSNSGGANIPRMTIDSNGVIHVIWRDIQDGITFTSNVTYTKNITRSDRIENIWSDPLNGNNPFESYMPELFSDDSGFVHAFWVDDRSRLFHSRIDGSLFGFYNSWSRPSILDEYVVAFDMIGDQLGSIHLSYMRNFSIDSKPAGIYYRKLSAGGSTWTQSIQLYESKYLRSVQKDNANVRIVSTPNTEDSSKIYIVWDNLPLRRVFLIQSIDNGESWEPFIEVDSPINPSGLSSPYNIDISANQDDIVLVWQVGQKGVSCSQYSKQSNNGGETWTKSQRILSQLSLGGCPQDNRIIGIINNISIMMTNTQGQIFLTAWNGSNWSDPQLQPTLGSFVDPVSLSNVDFRCHQTMIYQERLYVVGCDNGAGNDIWFTNSLLGDLSEWFPPPSIWSDPSIISSNSDEFHSPQVVTDLIGGVHIFWTHPTGIYYSRWDGNQWIQPSEIIVSPFSDFDQLAAGIDEQNGILYLVWTRADSGELLFSWSNISGATQRNEWAKPQSLTTSNLVNNSPDIHVDSVGNISIIYSVAINEERGVYLVRSGDRGKSWDNSTIVFNAVDSGWEIVDQTRISKTGDGSIISTWVQSSLRSGPLGVFFTRIPEFGNPIKPSFVTSNNIVWNDVHGNKYNFIHRFWQDVDNDQSRIWHFYSDDLGVTWTTPYNISSIGESTISTNLTTDKFGQPHLTYLSKDDTFNFSLKHLIWNGVVWQPGESAVLDGSNVNEFYNIVSTINSGDVIFSIFAQSNKQPEEEGENYSLLYTKRLINISEPNIETIDIQSLPDQSTPILSESPTPETSSGTTPTTIPTQEEVIPTQEEATPTQDQPIINSNNSFASLFLGIGLALIIILIILGLRLLFIRIKN